MQNIKLWNTPLNVPLKSSRLVRRVILDHNLPAGWLVKWGGKWDIAMSDGRMIPTGLRNLEMTGQEWIDFITKHTIN